MALNLNVLAQAAQLLEENNQQRVILMQMFDRDMAIVKRAIAQQAVLINGLAGELAVYRMMEVAIREGTWEESDGAILQEMLTKVRADAQQAQSEFFTPEQLAQKDKELDEKLAAMRSTAVADGAAH